MNKYTTLAIIAILGVIAFTACQKKGGPTTPNIVYDSLSKNVVFASDTNDGVTLTIKYSVPTANIPASGSLGDCSFFMVDTREVPEIEYEIPFPLEADGHITPENRSVIKGFATLNLSTQEYFILRSTNPNGDTIAYNVYLIDPSGVKSNTITIDPVYIEP